MTINICNCLATLMPSSSSPIAVITLYLIQGPVCNHPQSYFKVKAENY